MRQVTFYGYTLLILGLNWSDWIHVTYATNGVELLRDLFRNYDVSARPVNNLTIPMKLTIDIGLQQLLNMDDRNQVLTTSIWMRQRWKDENLKWNASEYGGIERLTVKNTRVWKPDITLYNSVAEEERSIDDYLVIITPDGTVTWNYPVITKSYCKIDVRLFPYDRQYCTLKYGSWALHGFELDVVNKSSKGDYSSYINNTAWDLIDITAERNEVFYSCCPEPYPDVTFTIIIERRPLFYLYNLVLPCLFMLIIPVMGFYLPVESGEKVSLGVTVLLALTVFLLLVAENLPPQSESIPLIGMYFGAAIAILAMSSCFTVAVLNLHHRGDNGDRVPAILRTVVLGCLARMLCMKDLVDNNTKAFVQSMKYTIKEEDVPGVQNGEADIALTSYANGSYKHEDHEVHVPIRRPSTQNPTANHIPSAHVIMLKKILQYLRDLRERKRSADAKERLQVEWRLVAMVLDRLMLILFAVVTVFVSVFILAYKPIFEPNAYEDH